MIRLPRDVVDQKSPGQIELIPAKGKTDHADISLINVLKEFFDEKSSTNKLKQFLPFFSKLLLQKYEPMKLLPISN